MELLKIVAWIGIIAIIGYGLKFIIDLKNESEPLKNPPPVDPVPEDLPEAVEPMPTLPGDAHRAPELTATTPPKKRRTAKKPVE